MQTIDHDPKEKRPTNAIWWISWGILALCWVGYLWFNKFQIWPLSLGGFTGLVLASWAIDITGNKSWPS